MDPFVYGEIYSNSFLNSKRRICLFMVRYIRIHFWTVLWQISFHSGHAHWPRVSWNERCLTCSCSLLIDLQSSKCTFVDSYLNTVLEMPQSDISLRQETICKRWATLGNDDVLHSVVSCLAVSCACRLWEPEDWGSGVRRGGLYSGGPSHSEWDSIHSSSLWP